MSPEKPVALLHSYLPDREGRKIPDKLGRIGVLAASELYRKGENRKGEISKICITVEPYLASLLTKRLNTLLNNPPIEDLVVLPQAVSTFGEVETFRKLADENDWNNLLTIGNHEHLPRIRRVIDNVFPKTDKNIDTTSPKEILSKYPRYKNILDDMDNWPEQQSFNRVERFINIVRKIPFLKNFAESHFSEVLPSKIALHAWIFRQSEKRNI